MTDTPIVVNGSPSKVQIEAAIRSFFVAVGPIVGIIAGTSLGVKLHLNDAVAMILTYVGPASALVAFVWGSLATRSHATKAVAMAEKLPDSIATTK